MPTSSNQMVQSPDPNPELDHYNYDHLNASCDCWLCSGQRRLEAEAVEAQASCEGHNYRCPCASCRAMRAVRMRLIAHANKRDAYSELSFAVRNRRQGPELLTWMLTRLHDDEVKEWWWAYHAEKQTIGDWLRQWYDHRHGRFTPGS